MTVQTPISSTPGLPVVADGQLISTSPATGAEVGRFPVADADAVRAAVARARAASQWWRDLGFDGRKARLLRWRVVMTKRLQELIDLMHAEGGKPTGDALIECVVALDHIAWSGSAEYCAVRGIAGDLAVEEHACGIVPAVDSDWKDPGRTRCTGCGEHITANAVTEDLNSHRR